MIVVMQYGASKEDVERVEEYIRSIGYDSRKIVGEERTVIGVVGDERPLEPDGLELIPGVERVMRILHPFKFASREFHPHDSVFAIDGVKIGGPEIIIMAGPCAVESREQTIETAIAVKEAGARVLRGGAYKPRTSPYSFQGMAEDGLKILAEARQITGLPVITEVIAPENVPLVSEYADILQIGARNMQNFALLQAVGQSGKPALLKRGLMSTIDEWLNAAEYILSNGNERVILCERGIRTFETATRYTTDINAIPVVKHLSHLPIILDPSHATGKWEYVTAVARAAIAAGADGLIVEVHPDPVHARSDGAQSLKPEKFADLVRQVKRSAQALDRF